MSFRTLSLSWKAVLEPTAITSKKRRYPCLVWPCLYIQYLFVYIVTTLAFEKQEPNSFHRNWPSLCPHLRAWLTLFTRCEISPVVSVSSTNCTPWPSWISVTWRCVCRCQSDSTKYFAIFRCCDDEFEGEKKHFGPKLNELDCLESTPRSSLRQFEHGWTWSRTLFTCASKSRNSRSSVSTWRSVRTPPRGGPQLGALNEHPKGSWASCIFDRFF